MGASETTRKTTNREVIMEIQVYQFDAAWHFSIRTKNNSVIAESARCYANSRNAVAAAKLIAGSKLKVVIKE
jgi:hypothetical protein